MLKTIISSRVIPLYPIQYIKIIVVLLLFFPFSIDAQQVEVNGVDDDVTELLPEQKQKKGHATKLLEVDFWGGYSLLGAENKLGFRLAQVFFQMSPKLAVFARYDNSLSLDNIDFVVQKKGSGALWGGSLVNWNKKMATKIEIGQRFFSDKAHQQLFRLEQILYGHRFSMRVGGFLGVSSELQTEWHTYTGFTIPINKQFALEPTIFYSKNKVDVQAQFRALLGGKFHHPSGFELSAGAFYGQSNIVLENGNASIFGGYLVSLIPINDRLKGQIAINRENGLFNNLTTIGIGIKAKLDVKSI